jgi:hypothetical protein
LKLPQDQGQVQLLLHYHQGAQNTVDAAPNHIYSRQYYKQIGMMGPPRTQTNLQKKTRSTLKAQHICSNDFYRSSLAKKRNKNRRINIKVPNLLLQKAQLPDPSISWNYCNSRLE